MPADNKDHAPIVKGTVEVIRLIDSHTSEVRILGITYDGPNGVTKDDEVTGIVTTRSSPDGKSSPLRQPSSFSYGPL